MKNRAQEEMVGFGLIVIVVSVVLLVFLVLFISKPSEDFVESYEVSSFISSTLKYTTSCENQFEKLSVQNLIVLCTEEGRCEDRRNACDVLDEVLKVILQSGWKVGEERPLKGYVMSVRLENQEIFLGKAGNVTANYLGAVQDVNRGGNLIEVSLKVYS